MTMGMVVIGNIQKRCHRCQVPGYGLLHIYDETAGFDRWYCLHCLIKVIQQEED